MSPSTFLALSDPQKIFFLVILTLCFPSRTQTWLLQKSEIPKLPSHHDSQKENAEKPQETAGPIARDSKGAPAMLIVKYRARINRTNFFMVHVCFPENFCPI